MARGRAGRRRHDSARHDRASGPTGARPVPGDHLARPAAGLAGPRDQPVVASRIPARGSHGGRPPFPQGGGTQLACPARARGAPRGAQAPPRVGADESPPHGSICRFDRLPGGLPALRLQAPAVGGATRLEVAGARDQARAASRPRAGERPARRGDARGERGDGDTGRYAGDGRRGRQGLRDPGLGRIHARGGRALVRHDGDDQLDERPLLRADAGQPGVPGRPPGPLQRRSADLPRLLDGQLVQGAVRPPGTRGGREARYRAGGPVRRARRCRAAGLDGPHAAALLEPGRAPPRPRRQGGRDRFR